MINTTALENATNIHQYTVAVNDALGQWPIFLMLGVFFIIGAVSYKKYENDLIESLLVDGFVTSILAGLLWSADLLEFKLVIIPIIIFISSLIIIAMTDR